MILDFFEMEHFLQECEDKEIKTIRIQATIRAVQAPDGIPRQIGETVITATIEGHMIRFTQISYSLISGDSGLKEAKEKALNDIDVISKKLTEENGIKVKPGIWSSGN